MYVSNIQAPKYIQQLLTIIVQREKLTVIQEQQGTSILHFCLWTDDPDIKSKREKKGLK